MKKFLFVLVATVTVSLLSGCLSDDEGPSLEERLETELAEIDAYLLENDIDVQEDASGIRYIIKSQGSGDSVRLGDVIGIQYTARELRSGAIVGRDTVGVLVTLQSRLIEGWRIMLPKLLVGGEITFYCPAVYAFGEVGNGGNIGPNTNLSYEMKVIGRVSDSVSRLDIEGDIIDEYLAENSINAQVDPSGIRFQKLQLAAGPSPTLSSRVRVRYEGRLMNVSTGFLFDQSNESGAIFLLNNLIEAWKIMIPTMSQGERIRIYTPSVYAYGESGSSGIPANAILIFDIELLEVR